MPKSALSPISKFEPLPRFVTGSIFRHIAVMTGTSAIGLMAIFVSDFANIFFSACSVIYSCWQPSVMQAASCSS